MSRITALLIIAAALSAAACSDSVTGPTSPSSVTLASGSGGGTAAASRPVIEAMLTPESGSAFQRASGKAKWESRDATRRELQIEVEDVAPGTRLNFMVGGAQFGATQTVDGLGNARIDLSTQLGNQVPSSVEGQRVEVRTENGALVVSGAF